MAAESSTKVYVGERRVPFREVALTNGESFRLYDTSGPGPIPASGSAAASAPGCLSAATSWRRGSTGQRARQRWVGRGANRRDMERRTAASAARRPGQRVTQLSRDAGRHHEQDDESSRWHNGIARDVAPPRGSATASPAGPPCRVAGAAARRSNVSRCARRGRATVVVVARRSTLVLLRRRRGSSTQGETQRRQPDAGIGPGPARVVQPELTHRW